MDENENEIELEEETTGGTSNLDWKAAAMKLKSVHTKYQDDYTIDTYFIKRDIDKLRDRYNSKERTTVLYSDIMALVEV